MARVHHIVDPLVNVDDRVLELVERKGMGHPDSLVDTIATYLSIQYSKYTMEHFGHVYHHNIDKVTLSGGGSEPRFGGGEIIEPVIVDFVGRAIRSKDEKQIPIYILANDVTREVVTRNVSEKYVVKIDTWKVKKGSKDLIDIIEKSAREGTTPKANDTSYATAWAPYSKQEQLVIDIENYMRTKLKKKYKFIGSDIKIMSKRIKEELVINIAVAFIDEHVNSLDEYLNGKEAILEEITNRFNLNKDKVYINTADMINGKNDFSIYLTVTGSSSESGDDGQVGRGNRVTGLISAYRPQTLEAIAGKNPTNHVGNFYNIWAMKIAEEIYKETGVRNNVLIVSTIGKPIDDCDVFVSTESEVKKSIIDRKIDEVISSWQDILKDILNLRVKYYPYCYIPK